MYDYETIDNNSLSTALIISWRLRTEISGRNWIVSPAVYRRVTPVRIINGSESWIVGRIVCVLRGTYGTYRGIYKIGHFTSRNVGISFAARVSHKIMDGGHAWLISATATEIFQSGNASRSNLSPNIYVTRTYINVTNVLFAFHPLSFP